MKSMKLSAIVLSLAAAGAFAQATPATEAPKADSTAAQPAAQTAVQPAAEVPAAETTAATPATEAPATETPTAEATAAEQAAAQPAAETPANEAPAAETTDAENPAVENSTAEAQPAEAAPAEITEAPKAEAAEEQKVEAKVDAPETKKGMEFKISGQAEFDTYANWKNETDNDLNHQFWSTVDVDFQVKFNEQWSAQVEIEADGALSDPSVYYNGAFVQYERNENFAIKFGDLTYSEGAFNYYGYNDPSENAAGMAEHNIRGLEFDFYGLQLGIGFTRSSYDLTCSKTVYDMNGNPYPKNNVCKSYDAHIAYQFDFAGQILRPFAHYQSWQTAEENEIHAGLEAALEFGPFALHAVYGLHLNNSAKDPNPTHVILAEPTFNVANVTIKGGFFYATTDNDATIHTPEIPEYMFGYGEGDIKFNDAITVGILGELHTNSLYKDTDLGTLNVGTRIYFTPVDGLKVTGFAMAIIPMGDEWGNDWEIDYSENISTKDYGDNLNLEFGVETVFSF